LSQKRASGVGSSFLKNHSLKTMQDVLGKKDESKENDGKNHSKKPSINK
jgi:hypothetical protein